MTLAVSTPQRFLKHRPALQSRGTVLICCQKGKIMGANVLNRVDAGISAIETKYSVDSQPNHMILAE